MLATLQVETRARNQMIDITAQVAGVVTRSGMRSGLCLVFVPHTTAAVTINENADPSVRHDMLLSLEKLVPADAPYTHVEGNSDSHLKASLIGSSVAVIVDDGRLQLGIWQGIFFCEFDGPRRRQLHGQGHGRQVRLLWLEGNREAMGLAPRPVATVSCLNCYPAVLGKEPG